jgi:ParB-like chromosome segregation protein Spo0J
MPTVLLDNLSIIDSPRLAGVNDDHVRTLSESADRWPPITVHRTTMRVLDGVHRVHSARLRGQRHIEARFYEGTDQDAFVVAVQANTMHGLPLSLADRARAAERIIGSHPQWSNGKIAAVTGLSAKTVAAVRSCSTREIPESNTRLGLDGRVRPLDSAAARMLAGELLRDHPGAPIREIASAAKLSASTTWDVRKRLERGEHPVPQRQRGGRRSAGRRSADPASLLRTLSRDPSLRSTESGRALLRRLHATSPDPGEWERLLATGNIPPHCLAVVTELALVNAQSWTDLARRLRAEPARAS